MLCVCDFLVTMMIYDYDVYHDYIMGGCIMMIMMIIIQCNNGFSEIFRDSRTRELESEKKKIQREN